MSLVAQLNHQPIILITTLNVNHNPLITVTAPRLSESYDYSDNCIYLCELSVNVSYLSVLKYISLTT